MNYMMPHSPKETIKLIDSGILKDKTFLVKDMCDVKGLRCSCGNPDFYKKCLPAKDFAPFLKKILLEGASLHGITICDEFFSRHQSIRAHLKLTQYGGCSGYMRYPCLYYIVLPA